MNNVQNVNNFISTPFTQTFRYFSYSAILFFFFRRNIPDEPNGLETPQEKKERMISIRIIYFTMFLMSLGFSIILTGVWPYLDKVSNFPAFERCF
jgi:hypothetical protein